MRAVSAKIKNLSSSGKIYYFREKAYLATAKMPKGKIIIRIINNTIMNNTTINKNREQETRNVPTNTHSLTHSHIFTQLRKTKKDDKEWVRVRFAPQKNDTTEQQRARFESTSWKLGWGEPTHRGGWTQRSHTRCRGRGAACS